MEKAKEEKPSKTKGKGMKIFALAVIVILIASAIVIIVKIKGNADNIEVEGVKFTKSPLGELMFYKANYPVMGFSPMGPVLTGYREILFRNDPRTFRNIPANFSFGLNLVQEGKVYVTVDKNMRACKENGLAMIDLGRFLTVAGYTVKGAINDPFYSNDTKKTPYVTCETHPENTVILIKGGSQTKIEQTAPNCYELSFAYCEISRVGEKFQLEVFKNTLKNIEAMQNLTAQVQGNSQEKENITLPDIITSNSS
jgi:hypothetical protein